MDPFKVFKTTDISNLTLLDKGGEGCLYKGELPHLGSVAIKIYRVHNFTNKKEIEFLQTHSGHENIVKLYGLVENDSRLVPGEWSGFVMEYMSCSLFDLIYKESVFYSFNQITSWIHQASKGVEFIHGNGYIHRDIKPHNLLLGAEMNNLKICDFGISKPFENNTLTVGRGTFLYMAPEVFDGCNQRDAYGTAADIFSLGITINEIVTRRKPYAHLGKIENGMLLSKIIQNERPIFFDESIDPILLNLVKLSLSAQAGSRPSIGEFINHTKQKISSSFDRKNQTDFEIFRREIEKRKMMKHAPVETPAKLMKIQTFPEDQKFFSTFDKDDFKVLGWLGKGLDSEILEADSVKVALKLFDYGVTKEVLTLFTRLHHPNLIQIYGLVNETLAQGTRFGLVMELYANISIANIVEKECKNSFTYREKCSWMLQGARALAYLHSQGVIHSNLGPENFLLNKKMSLIKLSGFALAEPFGGTEKRDLSQKVNSHQLMKNYLSTQQGVHLNRIYSYAADICAFNWVIFLLFHKTNRGVARFIRGFDSIFTEANPFSNRIRPELCGEDLANLLARGWDTDPDKRPSAVDYVTFFNEKMEETKGNGILSFISH